MNPSLFDGITYKDLLVRVLFIVQSIRIADICIYISVVHQSTPLLNTISVFLFLSICEQHIICYH
jgi:hypothetical protein